MKIPTYKKENQTKKNKHNDKTDIKVHISFKKEMIIQLKWSNNKNTKINSPPTFSCMTTAPSCMVNNSNYSLRYVTTWLPCEHYQKSKVQSFSNKPDVKHKQ